MSARVRISFCTWTRAGLGRCSPTAHCPWMGSFSVQSDQDGKWCCLMVYDAVWQRRHRSPHYWLITIPTVWSGMKRLYQEVVVNTEVLVPLLSLFSARVLRDAQWKLWFSFLWLRFIKELVSVSCSLCNSPQRIFFLLLCVLDHRGPALVWWVLFFSTALNEFHFIVFQRGTDLLAVMQI